MPHQSFGAVRTAATREPVTFDLGIFDEHTFTCVPDPTLGDTFDLHDAPEILDNELQAVRALARFIRRMVIPEDRARFDEALYRIPVTERTLLVEVAAYISERLSGFPQLPPTTSSGGRRSTGTSSKRRPAGTGRSKR